MLTPVPLEDALAKPAKQNHPAALRSLLQSLRKRKLLSKGFIIKSFLSQN
jgi:hypothetical protein